MQVLSRRFLPVLLLVAFGVGFVGCDSGGSSSDDDTLSADKAKEEISNVDRNLSSDISSLTTGEAAAALNGLTQPVDVNGFQQPFWSVLLGTLDGQGISLETGTGEYRWDSDSQSWESVGQTDGTLVLNFPTSPDASENNATFTRSEYSTEQVTIDGNPEPVPTAVDVSLETDDAGEIFSVDLSDTEFYPETVDGSQVPESFLLKVLTAPQFHTFQLDSPSKDQFNFEFDLEKGEGGEKVLGLIVEAALTSDFNNISGIEGVDELTGSVELGPDVVIDYTVNVDGAAALPDDPSVEQINNQFSATINVEGQKAADIKFAEVSQNGRSEVIPVVVYPDESQEPLQQAFSNTFSTILGSPIGNLSSTAKSAAGSVADTVWGLFQ